MNPSTNHKPGTLYVVATPIGNRSDMSQRAIETLRTCDWVACEDTRHSRRLFDFHGIDTKTLALHQHNENQQSEQLINRILNGENAALVSDAGTPLISDPGFPLVKLAHHAGIVVSPIPGPSAVVTLLSAAAINAQPFTFHGFLPAKSTQRLKALATWHPLHSTQVFYESSHRIMGCLTDLEKVFGPHATLAMGRELTKTYEQVVVDSIANIKQQLYEHPERQKGEFVLALQGEKPEKSNNILPEAEQLAARLLPLLPPKTVAKVVAEHFELNKKQVYQYLLQHKD